MTTSAKIESYLFYTGEAVSIKKLAKVFDVSEGEINDGLHILEQNLDGHGMVLIKNGDEVMLATHPEMGEIIQDIEKQVREIKETNNFVLPEAIRYNYPKLCSINIFSEVKKIQNKEMRYTNELKDLYNEREMIKHQLSQPSQQNPSSLATVEDNIRKKVSAILSIKDEYLEIDGMFEKEMLINRISCSKRYQLCGFFKV